MSTNLTWISEHNGVWAARSGNVTRARIVDNDRGGWEWAVYQDGWTVDVGHERTAKAAQDAVAAAIATADARKQAVDARAQAAAS